MVEAQGLADRLGLEVSSDSSAGMLILSGSRGVVVFNPLMRAVLIDDEVCFRGHRVVIDGERVSVPEGFVASCEERLRPRPPKKDPKPKETEQDSPPPPAAPRFHVVLDPGHGGRDPGAISVHGAYEKTVNLTVSRLVAAKLRSAGIRVTMTRDRDVFVQLNDRAAVANRLRADAFVSIHADSCRRRLVRGFTLYVLRNGAGRYSDATRASVICGEYGSTQHEVRSLLTRNRARNTVLASAIRLQMQKATDSPDRGTHLGELRVLERAACPAVLIELGFLSHSLEAKRLFRPAYQEALAAAITQGIRTFLKRN